MKSLFFPFTILALVVGFCFYLPHAFPAIILQKHSEDPQIVCVKCTVVGWDSGKRIWRFNGDQLVVDHQGEFLTYKGHGTGSLFEKDKPYMTIRAPEIRFDLISRSLQALQGVSLSATPDTKAVTAALYWNQFTQKLFIPGEISVWNSEGFFKARHLLLTLFDGKVKMSSVTMAFQPESLFKFTGIHLEDPSLFEKN